MELSEPFAPGALAVSSRFVAAPLIHRRIGEGRMPTALMAAPHAQRANGSLLPAPTSPSLPANPSGEP